MGTGTISSIGIGSGLQLQDILDQLREVDDEAIIAPKQEQITEYQDQLTEISTVENKLYTLKSKALDLSLSSSFLSRTVTSSDEDVLTATVIDGASEQSATIVVSALAQKSSWMASSGASSTDAIVYVPTSVESSSGVADPAADTVASTDGTLVITFGGSSTITVDVGPTAGVTTMDDLVNAINTDGENVGSGDNGRLVTASTFVRDGQYYLRIETDTSGGTGEANRVTITSNDTDLTLSAPDKTFAYQVGDTTVTVDVAADTTLQQFVDLINDDTDNPGITASIIDDGTTSPYRLVLQADETGEDYRISLLTQLPDMPLAEQAGSGGSSLNAQFTVDGISYQRQSNSFNDVISGVTITLQGTGTSSLSVSADDDTLQTMITELVEAYNDVVQEIQTNVAWDDEEEKFGVLASTTLRDLPYDLQNLMTQQVTADSDGNIQTLFDLGLEFNRDGTITIDADTLSSAIQNYRSGVQAFFLGDDDAGVTGFADRVNERLRALLAADGQVDAEKDAADARISDLEAEIAAQTERLDKKYELLTKQFIELDRYMNQMTSMSNFLSSQFDSLSSMWGGKK